MKAPLTLCRTHAAAAEALAVMRHKNTSPREFAWQLNRLSLILAVEVTRDLSQTSIVVQTPLAPCDAKVLEGHHVIVPIQRSGEGMVNAFRTLIADNLLTWDMRIVRDEATAKPIFQDSRVPQRKDMPRVNRTFVLDPALATAGTACYAISHLKERGIEQITFVGVIGCPTGVERLQNEHPDVDIVLGEIDPEIDDRFFIKAGFGDGGDRQRPILPWSKMSLAARLNDVSFG